MQFACLRSRLLLLISNRCHLLNPLLTALRLPGKTALSSSCTLDFSHVSFFFAWSTLLFFTWLQNTPYPLPLQGSLTRHPQSLDQVPPCVILGQPTCLHHDAEPPVPKLAAFSPEFLITLWYLEERNGIFHLYS